MGPFYYKTTILFAIITENYADMKRLLQVLILLSSICSYAQEKKPNKGIFINPVTMDFNLTEGQTSTQKVVVTNNLDKRVLLRVYLNDWLRDTIGGHLYMEPGTYSYSCSKWLTLDKGLLDLGPGQTMEVTVKMHVPDSANAVKTMKWSMLFLESVHEKTLPKTQGVTTAVTSEMRFGIHIYQTPPSVTVRDIKMLSFGALLNLKNTYRIVCENTGETQLYCNSYIELVNIITGEKTTVKSTEFPMFPGQKKYFDFVIPATLPKGKYTITGVVDAGSDLPLEASQITRDIN